MPPAPSIALLCLTITLVSVVAMAPARAGTVTVGGGSSIVLGDGRLDLGCADLAVLGTLDAGSVGMIGARDVVVDPSGSLSGGDGVIELSGDWEGGAGFSADNGVVRIVDGCGLSSGVIVGDNDFATLEVITTSARLQSVESGTTQSVGERIVLRGNSGALLQIRSTIAGVEAFFDLNGTHLTNFVDVDDNHAIGAVITYSGSSSVGSNVVGWQFAAPGVPLLGMLGAGGLIASLLAGGLARRRLYAA